MFDFKYYENKKANLEQRFLQKKNKLIALMTQALNQYYEEEREIIHDIQEIITKLEEFKAEEIKKEKEGDK